MPASKFDDEISPKQYLSLFIIACTGIAYLWQLRGFSYAYGFHGAGEMAGNPYYELSAAFPEITSQYSFLSATAIEVPQILLGLYIGKLSDKLNRAQMLGFACLIWSASTYFAGTVDNFTFFVAMRVTLGIFATAATPPAVSLIRDIFPPSFQTQA